jgi:hypothetical protein
MDVIMRNEVWRAIEGEVEMSADGGVTADMVAAHAECADNRGEPRDRASDGAAVGGERVGRPCRCPST